MPSRLGVGQGFQARSKNKASNKSNRFKTRLSLEFLEDRNLFSATAILAENQLPGTPQSVWDIQYSGGGAGDPTIEGYSTDISVNHGQTVSFKINDTQNAPYHLDIYRMGYYQGNGARLITTISSAQTIKKVQPNAIFDSTTGLLDAGNWSVTATWAVPANAVSGIYFAHVIRDDTGGDFHIPFVVRDDNDANPSNILFQTDDTTWEAYNQWGNQSLYFSNTQAAGRAYKVSYNRPFETRTTAAVNWVFADEYPMVRWLEANGYDVSYFTGMDAERNGAQILQHKMYLTAGHDEYWSGQQRANVEAAVAQGVNMSFLTGNDIFWKTRWENSTDGTNTPYRTLVSYKETWPEQKIDPQDPPTWTGTWRDPTFSPPADGGRPENGLTGTLFMVNGNQGDQNSYHSILVPAQYAGLRFWRNTAVANLQAGQTYALPAGTLGFEWNVVPDNGFEPAGSINMSSTTLDVSPNFLLNYGTVFGSGTATHSLHLYRNQTSKALVFSAGTVDYAWGLDSNHDFNGIMSTPDMGDQSDINLQQATVNLFADMNVQPGSLQPGLVSATASTITTPPTSVVTAPPSGTKFLTGSQVTISGTAKAVTGAVVAGVEVSLDGGATWHPVSIASVANSTTWSLSWTPAVPGSVTIRSRAVDDNGNLETPSAGVTVTVIEQGWTIFSGAAAPRVISSDSQSVELGVKFTSDTAGQIAAIRFYKGSNSVSTHSVHLWSSTGQLLATGTSSGETAAGWQQVNFASPVSISANTTYVASYFTPVGQYAADANYFSTAGVDSPPLHALSNATQGGDGVYAYSTSSTFPNQTFAAANYWVDVVLTNPNTANPIIYSVGPAPGASLVSTSTRVIATFNKAMDPTTINTNTFLLKDPNGNVVAATVTYDSGTQTAFLTPTAALAPATYYTLSVLGGVAGPVVKDTSGNALASTYSSSFLTDGPAPVISSTSPTAGATGVSNAATVSVTFSHAMDPTTLTNNTLFLKDSSGNLLPATISYNSGTATSTITTRSFLLTSTTYTATVIGGSTGTVVKDLNGRPLAATYTWSFTTSANGSIYPSLWHPSSTPVAASAGGAGGPLEIGVKFRSDLGGAVTGIRFYKGTSNTGSHIGNLWTVGGQLLATANFTAETASGWQQVNFANPVTISPNTIYVASYFSPSGFFAQDLNYFSTTGMDGSPLHAPATGAVAGGNGVYNYSTSSSFPNQTYNGSNYWVDVVFQVVPSITSVSPAAGATMVSTASPFTVTFSEAMDPTTITTSTFLLKDPTGTVVPATVSYNSTTFTATLTPNAALNPDITYTASVLGGSSGPVIKDQGGNALLATYSWSFLTDGPAPVVSSTAPAAGATGVGTAANVTVTFSHGMDPTTITNSTILIKDPSGNVVPANISYDPVAYTATLTPTGFFSTSSTYTGTVVGGTSGTVVKDVNGHALAANYTWSFTTTAQPSLFPSLWRSSSTPQVFSSDTSSLELGVKFYSSLPGFITGVRFYKASGSTGTHIGNLWTAGGQLLATANFTGETASGWQQVNFSTPVGISANTTYVASYFVPAGHYAADANYFTNVGVDSYPLHAPASGAVAGGNGVYAYTSTSAFPGQSYTGSNYWADVVFSAGAAVTSTTPIAGAGGVAVTASVTVTFTKAMDPTTITTNTIQLKDPSGNVVAASVSYNSSTFTATLTPNAALNTDTTYTGLVVGGSSGVKDTSGNAMAANYTWSFFTDGPAPVVNSVAPAATSTGIAPTVTVSVTFSHIMDSTTISSSTFFLKGPSGTTVAATVTYNAGTNTATLTPNGPLNLANTYTATVLAGSTGAKDPNGRSLAANYSWSFTIAPQTSLWAPTATPQTISTDSHSVELGVKFYSSVSGYISGIRFYKGSGNTGTHIGNLWTTGGQLLATATFTGETATGWQQVNFATPVSITANTTYLASYFAPVGRYAVDAGFFNTAGLDTAFLHAPSSPSSGGNGVYKYSGSSSFPGLSYNGSNYWVDVVFSTPPSVIATTPAAGATGVSSTTAITITFDRALDPTTINSSTFVLKDSAGNVVAATVTYNASTNTVTLTPTARLNLASTYNVFVFGGSSGPRVRDQYGNYLASTFSWSFTTGNS